MAVYLSSSNPLKYSDVTQCFEGSASPPRWLRQDVTEILSSDLDALVRAKAMAAYRQALVPLFVEHGGLYIDHMKGLPGPLVKPFWEKLEERICELIPEGATRRAHVVQMVCYCDGKVLRTYEGRMEGVIAPERRGDGGIHWEPVFIPDGLTQTLGEMAQDQKLRWSGTAKAYAQLRSYLAI